MATERSPTVFAPLLETVVDAPADTEEHVLLAAVNEFNREYCDLIFVGSYNERSPDREFYNDEIQRIRDFVLQPGIWFTHGANPTLLAHVVSVFLQIVNGDRLIMVITADVAVYDSNNGKITGLISPTFNRQFLSGLLMRWRLLGRAVSREVADQMHEKVIEMINIAIQEPGMEGARNKVRLMLNDSEQLRSVLRPGTGESLRLLHTAQTARVAVGYLDIISNNVLTARGKQGLGSIVYFYDDENRDNRTERDTEEKAIDGRALYRYSHRPIANLDKFGPIFLRPWLFWGRFRVTRDEELSPDRVLLYFFSSQRGNNLPPHLATYILLISSGKPILRFLPDSEDHPETLPLQVHFYNHGRWSHVEADDAFFSNADKSSTYMTTFFPDVSQVDLEAPMYRQEVIGPPARRLRETRQSIAAVTETREDVQEIIEDVPPKTPVSSIRQRTPSTSAPSPDDDGSRVDAPGNVIITTEDVDGNEKETVVDEQLLESVSELNEGVRQVILNSLSQTLEDLLKALQSTEDQIRREQAVTVFVTQVVDRARQRQLARGSRRLLDLLFTQRSAPIHTDVAIRISFLTGRERQHFAVLEKVPIRKAAGHFPHPTRSVTQRDNAVLFTLDAPGVRLRPIYDEAVDVDPTQSLQGAIITLEGVEGRPRRFDLAKEELPLGTFGPLDLRPEIQPDRQVMRFMSQDGRFELYLEFRLNHVRRGIYTPDAILRGVLVSWTMLDRRE